MKIKSDEKLNIGGNEVLLLFRLRVVSFTQRNANLQFCKSFERCLAKRGLWNCEPY
jgi:hypothetical protein